MKDYIKIQGARQHNLKNINLKIPKNKLVVFTGISGSGKSSLAFDTIYAEGQRRYVESLSSYARQFLGIMDKPDVDSIKGLSPAISIEQKAASHNPRSTVATLTEIYDYLRLLFARIGHPHCPNCGKEIAQQSPQEIGQQILNFIVSTAKSSPQARFLICSPVVRDRKGEFSGLFDNLRKKGFQRARIDSQIYDLDEEFVLIKTNKHTIDAVIDRITFGRKDTKSKIAVANLKSRLMSSVETALELSDGLVILSQVKDKSFNFPDKPKKFTDHLYSENYACPECNLSLPEIEPRSFSFNSPHGACPTCSGIGSLLKVDPELVINENLSINEGAILPFARLLTKQSRFLNLIKTIVAEYHESVRAPFKALPISLKQLLLYGDPSRVFTVYFTNRFGHDISYETTFEGIITNLERRYQETQSDFMRSEIQKYMRQETCPSCQGTRLKPEALSVTIDQKNIAQITSFFVDQAFDWIKNLTQPTLSEKEAAIAQQILKEISTRLRFLSSVGLNYLTLNRQAATLAGGEAQRIRLASQIGTGLTGVLYILDEPTIGLHQRDNQKLIKTLKDLRNLGNTVIVVEHDRETMENADSIIDFGPGAGKLGGQIVFQGTPAQIKKSRSLTGQYLANKKKVKVKKLTNNPSIKPATPSLHHCLTLSGCRQHNLKNITVNFPLGKFICISGVSGSGKSTLIHDTLYHALASYLNPQHKQKPGTFGSLTSWETVTRLSLIDQSPIGRTPRSNPVTYTKAFDHIRDLFSQTQEARIRGYQPGRFSFNVKGGRCEACQGQGQVKIGMQFLPDIYVKCDVCQGSRYNQETLQVHCKGLSISQVLKLTVAEAVPIFKHIPALYRKLKTLQDVGLGYIELGQPAPTLSGGEAQRVKLAKELSIRANGHTLYLLDEPTTGLHFADLENLLFVLKALVNQGNTVIIIEHNPDIIKNADFIIDLGPEGGDKGGRVVASGTPQELAKSKTSYTGQVLKKILP